MEQDRRLHWKCLLAAGLLWRAVSLAQAQDVAPKWISGNEAAKLRDEEIPALQVKALEGSDEAAGKLFGYYMFSSYDRGKAIYWLTVQAENGSAMAAYNLGAMLGQESDADKRTRAIFWLKKAEASADLKASGLARGELHRLSR